MFTSKFSIFFQENIESKKQITAPNENHIGTAE